MVLDHIKYVGLWKVGESAGYSFHKRSVNLKSESEPKVYF